MPFNNGTGPNGQGPRTGRGMGNCNGQGSGRGFGQGQGRGFGNRRGGGAGPNNTQNSSWIGTQLNNLQAAIQKLTERLDNNK